MELKKRLARLEADAQRRAEVAPGCDEHDDAANAVDPDLNAAWVAFREYHASVATEGSTIKTLMDDPRYFQLAKAWRDHSYRVYPARVSFGGTR